MKKRLHFNIIITFYVVSLFVYSPLIKAQTKAPALSPVQEVREKKVRADIIVSKISRAISESGISAEFTVKLNLKPVDNVTIHFSSSDESEGRVQPEKLTFSADNWSKEQVVKVIGQNDSIKDGDQTFRINMTVVSQKDLRFSGLKPTPVHVINKDNDHAAFEIGKISGPTNEKGKKAEVTIRLKSEPTHSVIVGVASSHPSEGIVKQEKLFFTVDNWNRFHVISVQGQDDQIMDGNRQYQIVFKEAVSMDPNYHGLIPQSVPVVNLDDDSAAILTTKIKGNTRENKGNVLFSVKLKTKPARKVILDITSSDPGEGSVSPEILHFDANNWNKSQRVKIIGMDDVIDDGNQDYQIIISPKSSLDSAYRSLQSIKLDMINEDDDKVNILVKTLMDQTSETGDKATFSLKLATQPTANVHLQFQCQNPREGRLLLKKLTFTPEDWFREKFVTIVGIDDDKADGNQLYTIRILPVVSKDLKYNGLNPEDIQITNLDNESVGVGFSKISSWIDENGASASFTARLTSKPTQDVTIHFSSDRITEGILETSKLHFTALNWHKPQKITIKGQPDDVVDGDQKFTISAHLESQDTTYAEYRPKRIEVVNKDVNTFAVILERSEGDTDENGKSVDILMHLNSKPTSVVKADIISSNPGEGVPEPAFLTFDQHNWNINQKAIIKGVNDDQQDLDKTYQVTVTTENSLDSDYKKIPPTVFTILNRDNDKAGITIRPIDNTTSENGETAEFGIVLNSEPESSVVFIFSCDNEKEGKMIDHHAAFFPTNWNKEQIIKVTGVKDFIVDEDGVFHVTSLGAVSNDPRYNQMPFENIKMINLNNDKAGFIIGGVNGTTDETGGSTSFTVRLNSIPKPSVTIRLDSDDKTEGQNEPKELSFTADNWDKDQTVTVTGNSDKYKDGDQDYHIVFSPAESEDPNYHGIQPESVSVVNKDSMRATVGLSYTNINLQDELKENLDDFAVFGIYGGYVINRRVDVGLSLFTGSTSGSTTIFGYSIDNPMKYKLNLTAISFMGKYIFYKSFFNLYGQGGLDLYLWNLETQNAIDNSTKSSSGLSSGPFVGFGIDTTFFKLIIASLEASNHYVSSGLGNGQISLTVKYPF